MNPADRPGPSAPARFRIRRPRFLVATLVFGIAASFSLVAGIEALQAVVLAFSIAASVFLLAVARMFTTSDRASIRSRAREEDQGRHGILVTGVAISVFVLVALVLELREARSGGIALVLPVVALVLSWLFLNTMFALHYAHEYYGDGDEDEASGDGDRGGLDFPGENAPDYWDFAYFAFVIGMTFQVSDVEIRARHLRRVALAHGLVAFVFNVVIVALTVSVLAGKA